MLAATAGVLAAGGVKPVLERELKGGRHDAVAVGGVGVRQLAVGLVPGTKGQRLGGRLARRSLGVGQAEVEEARPVGGEGEVGRLHQ